MTNDNGSDIARRAFTDQDLSGIETFEDAVNLAAAEHGGIAAAHEDLGNGFEVLTKDEKGQLVGRTLFLVEWRFNQGEMGEFVSITAAVRNSDGTARKVIVNDGSTGLCAQLSAYSAKTGRYGGMMVKNGLRRSDYMYTDPSDGKEKKATTFYLDTSA